MTGLLILIIVLLIAIIVWLIGITILYAQIVRNFKKLATTDENAMRALFNSHTGMLQLVRETLDAMDAVNILVQEYRILCRRSGSHGQASGHHSEDSFHGNSGRFTPTVQLTCQSRLLMYKCL